MGLRRWSGRSSVEPLDPDSDESDETAGSALARGWRLLPRALHYLRPYKRSAGTSVGVTVLLAVMALAEPWPLAFIVDTVLA